MKEVKRWFNKEFLLVHLKEGKSPSKISKEFNIPKQNLTYYLRQLKNEGLIEKKGYGTWEVKNQTSNTPTKLKSKLIRGHAFIWKVKLHKKYNWLEHLKDFKLVRNIIPRILINNKKVWFCQKSIIIYEPNSFYGLNAIESRKYAVISLLETIKAIENKTKVNLQPYGLSISREHYSLIKNDLAKQCNRNNEKINIRDENGEWMWIDDSDGLNEIETGNLNALRNNIGIQKWWNEMKDSKFEVTPNFIKDSLMQVTTNQMVFDKNFKTHLDILNKLSKAIDELREELKNGRKN